MYPKPKGFNRVGIIQCFLAAFFVLWFLVFPQYGKYFAWPVVPELTAMFMGAGFMLRSYFGYHLWRDKYWYTLRWSMAGDYAFLGVLFVTTWWHISEMSWHLEGVSNGLRIFSLVIAHVWVFAYTFEALVIFLIHPRDKEAHEPIPAHLSEGGIQPVMKHALGAVFLFGAAFWALLFFTPEFANSRWPWELNPFDARIMSAWFAGSSIWAVTMYFMKDWAEIKVGVRALLFLILGLLAVWILASPRYELDHTEIAARQGIVFGFALGIMAGWLSFAYWMQEQARKKSGTVVKQKEHQMKTANWKTNTFHVGNARVLAEFASLAYENDKDKAKSTLMEKFGMKWVQFFRLEETEALVAYNDEALILAFRGTSSIEDAWTDVKIRLIRGPKGSGKIHEGFKTGLDKVWHQVWNAMGRARRNRTLWVTGHSLGGALALTATARLHFEKNQPVNGLYTFGQPRVGDPAFTAACHKAFGDRYFRFVHNNDIVPRVPFRLMGFEHTGIFKYINSAMKLDDTRTWEEITRDRLSGRIDHFLKPGADGISDHSMINYLKALSK